MGALGTGITSLAARPPLADRATLLPGATVQLAPNAQDNSTVITAGPPEAVGSAGWKLWNETTITPAVVDAIDGAKQVVNVEFFAISDGGKGAHVVDALVRAAERGVEVNVITDATAVGALPIPSWLRMKHRIEQAGGEVKVNLRVPGLSSLVPEGLRHVNHRKSVTVDGATAFVGGINFIKLEDDYHNSMVQLSGVSAARLASEQLTRWQRVGGTVSQRHAASVEQALQGKALIPTDPKEMRIVSNAPDERRFDITDGYVELIRGAKRRLWISSPGYSDRALLDEIAAAAARGVDVRLIAPGTPPLGIAPINWIGRSNLKRVMEHGAKSYEIPETLHRKSIIADDEVIFSSFNITGRSKTADHEVGVRTRDPEFVKAIEATLAKDMDRAGEIDAGKLDGAGVKFADVLTRTLKFSY